MYLLKQRLFSRIHSRTNLVETFYMSRLAIITGGSSGIGLGLARMCAQGGYDVHLVARNLDELKTAKKSIESDFNTQVSIQALDLSKPGSAQRVFNAAMKQGKEIEIIVNNAGFGDYDLVKDADWTTLSNMINLNVLALTNLSHLFAKVFVDQHSGRIMNVASTAAFIPGPHMAVYHASKAFVLNFTEALAEELKEEGVSVTVLCPGPTESNFAKYDKMRGSAIVERKLPSSEEVAKFGYNAMMDGKRVAIHGLGNKLATEVPRFAPRKTVSFVVNQIYGQRRSK